jgi:tRNA A-37 threonylcarbamoyl transferase component Bud32
LCDKDRSPEPDRTPPAKQVLLQEVEPDEAGKPLHIFCSSEAGSGEDGQEPVCLTAERDAAGRRQVLATEAKTEAATAAEARAQAATATAPEPAAMAVLMQFGSLVSENFRFRQLLRRNKKIDIDEVVCALLFLPIMAAEWIYNVLSMAAPQTLYKLAVFFMHGKHSLSESDIESFRFLWDILFFYAAIIIIGLVAGLQNVRRFGWWQPSHIKIGVQGITRIWDFTLTHFSGRNLDWQSVESVQLLSRKNRSGQLLKSVEIRHSGGKRLKIDLFRLSREQDREFFVRSLKLFAPQAAQSLSVQDAVAAGVYQPTYTRLWEQSLLAPPSRERADLLEPATVLSDGQYTIVKRIGTGGQGTAYLAQARLDEAFAAVGSEVVLKEYVLPDLGKMHDRQRALNKLEHEVSLLAKLKHPGIAGFIDVFVEDHRAYVVTEYVRGRSLRSRVEADGPLPPALVGLIAGQMCDVLHYLQNLDPPVIHQDLTPENVVFSEQGTARLIDFNVARESISLRTGLVVGKQGYMPPEQFKGKATPQSDVFALGCILYFLLTGKNPEPLSVARISGKIDPLTSGLALIVEKCTALDLEDRYASAEEIKKDLAELFKTGADSAAPADVMITAAAGEQGERQENSRPPEGGS